ncbi:MAG: glycosyltransferase [Acidobacteria bacterium]|nr:glycosyltransferase [Acidobacteriota bacterium]
MISLIVAVGWLGFGIVSLVVTLWTRWFPALERLQPGKQLTESGAGFLSVVVPVRNEAANIEPCLRGLLAQTYPSHRIKIAVVNDGSTDDTAAMVLRIAASDPRVQLVEAGPLPSGWTGKSHACWRGASTVPSDWICFVDADTRAAPTLMMTAVSFAETNGIDMLSLLPAQELESFWERLFFPGVLPFVDLWARLNRINDPSSVNAGASGQFILLRRQAHEAVHGHASVCGEIIEDLALARTVKQAGHRVYLMRGDDVIRVRMYTNLKGIWEGFSKNAVDVAGNVTGAVPLALATFLGGWMTLLLPAWTWAIRAEDPSVGLHTLAFGLSLLGTVLVLSLNAHAMRACRISPWYSLLYPLGTTLLAAILFNSTWTRLRGQTRWKGRVYDVRDTSAKMSADH